MSSEERKVTRREAFLHLARGISFAAHMKWALATAGVVLIPHVIVGEMRDLQQVTLVGKRIIPILEGGRHYLFVVEFMGEVYEIEVSREDYESYSVGTSGKILCRSTCRNLEKNFITDFREVERERERARQIIQQAQK